MSFKRTFGGHENTQKQGKYTLKISAPPEKVRAALVIVYDIVRAMQDVSQGWQPSPPFRTYRATEGGMAKDDQQEAYERLLTSSLARVVDFTKFAEAKNAALLTFASAWIIASVNLLNGSNSLTSGWQLAFMAALPFFASSALVALLSFLPKTDPFGFHKDPERERVLLFFGDAAAFSPESFRDRIRERYYPPEGETATRNYLDDLSTQTNINSQIALRKFKLFNVGARLIFVAFVILSIPAVYVFWTGVASPVLAVLSNLIPDSTVTGAP